MPIPKRLMQTWKTNVLPPKWEASLASIRRHMPTWDYYLMTDEDNRAFIAHFFPDFLATYDAFPHNIQRADAIRPCWLYVYGGLYMDCDYELQAPLDHLFDDDHTLYLLPSSNVASVFTNAFMASAPRHPFWLRYIASMCQSPGIYALERHWLIMNTTGPSALTRMVRQEQPPGLKTLPVEEINPYSICDTVPMSDTSLLRPLEGSSWVTPTGVCMQWMYCNSTTVLVIVVLILGVILLWLLCMML